jgi:uncharacterized protein YcfL
MRKTIVAFIILFLLVGCGREEGSNQTEDMTTICLDGVAYWFDGMGQSQMMAPRVDPETLTFIRCEE